MRVICIKTELNNPSQLVIRRGWAEANGYLTIGKVYEVFAIIHSNNSEDEFVLICDDFFNDLDYSFPIYVPAAYFQIVDPIIPSEWTRSVNYPDYEGYAELTPDKYENIVNGDPKAISEFRKRLYRVNGSSLPTNV